MTKSKMLEELEYYKYQYIESLSIIKLLKLYINEKAPDSITSLINDEFKSFEEMMKHKMGILGFSENELNNIYQQHIKGES